MKKVAVIRGDGVGPEIMDGVLRILRELPLDIELIDCDAGYEWWEVHGGDSLIPDDTWDKLEESDACLKGPTITPSGPNSPKSVAVSIRQRFDLYANLRPIRTYPNTKRPLGDVNFVCVRENTEGLYSGIEEQIDDDTYIAVRRITRRGCRRIAKFAFEEAKRRGWKRVVAIHKSNILKLTCGVFMEETRKVAEEHPGVELWDYHIDNMAQQLIKNPQIFNESILLSTNLFMDIISEECSALVGSIGLIPSANIGESYAMFEPAHGAAPKYKGLDKVNPVAGILAMAMMLDYLGENEYARKVERAVEECISEGIRTYDLGGSAKLSDVINAVISKVCEKV